MNNLPPHKRNLTTMYRAWFWTLKGHEAKVDKTPEDKKEIINCLYELDRMWKAMPLAQKRDIDPLWDKHKNANRQDKDWGWEETRVLRCPTCENLLHVAMASSGPPRCPLCMCDVAVVPSGRGDEGEATRGE